MLETFLVIVIILFFISFAITRDILSPACTICLSYLIAGFCGVIGANITDFDYSISDRTILILVVGLCTFLLVSCVLHLLLGRKKHSRIFAINLDSPIKLQKNYIVGLLGFEIVTLALYFYYFYKGVGGFNIATFTAVMSSFRANSYFDASIDYIPFVVKQMTKFAKAIAFIAIYILIYNFTYSKKEKEKYKVDAWCIAGIVIYIPMCFLTGGRYYAIMLFISGIFMWGVIHILLYKKEIKLKSIFKLACVMLVLLAFFSVTRTLVGRTSTAGFIEYITGYFGYSIKCLDVFLSSGEANSAHIWGKESFYGFNRILMKFGLVEPYKVYANFCFYNGRSLGNTYTAFRSQYYDFGMMGIVILQSIEAAILTIWYEKLFKNKIRKLSISLILYSDLMATLLLHSYSETFYSEIISLGFPVLILALLVFRGCGNLRYCGVGRLVRKKDL